MAKLKNKFAQVVCATRKCKTVAGATAPPPKRAHRAKEINMLPPPPAIEESTPTQPESSTRDTPPAAPTQIDAPQEDVGVGAAWLQGIQHLALALP